MPKKIILTSLLIFLGLIIFSNKIFSQGWDYSYTHFTKEDGLPSNVVYQLANDKDGFIWIGTDAGLVRFDGSHFKTYTSDDGLPSNDIFKLTCDSKNRIWIISMSKEICYYQNGIIHNKYNTPLLKKIEIKHQIFDILEDKDSTIWVTSAPNYIYKIKNGKIEKDSVKENINHSLAFNGKIYIFPTNYSMKNSKIIDGLIIRDDKMYYSINGTIFNMKINEYTKDMFSFNGFNWQIESKNKNYIFQYCNEGLNVYDFNNNLQKSNYLTKYSIASALHDIKGNLWISTLGNGLFKVNNNFTKVIVNNQSEYFYSNQSICVTPKYIYIGNNNSRIKILNRQTGKFINEVDISNYSVKSCRILKISNYKQNIFLSTDVGTFIMDESNFKVKKIAIIADKNHLIDNGDLILLKIGRYLKINLISNEIDTILFKNEVDTILLNKRLYSFHKYLNEILVGAEDGLYQKNNNSFSNYKLNEILNSRIMDIKSFDSTLILATVNNGIYFIKNHKVINRLTIANGISSNNCLRMQLVNDNLFIATNNGLNIYNFKTKKIRCLYESDGLVSNMVNDFLVENDTIYAATETGISKISFNNIDTIQSNILFSKPTIVGNDTIWNIDSVYETYTNNNFMLNLNALSYKSKGSVIFYYKLINLESNFIATKDQLINLKFTSPGTYEFQAYAEDINKVKSNLLKIKIIVLPHFWQTTWFYIICIILILVLIYLLFKFQEKRIQKKEQSKREINSKIHQLEISVWRSKINPHFLFNSLNSIMALIKTNRNDNAIDYINDFSKVLRNTIQNSDKLFHTIDEEINYLESILNLEMIKRENKFQFSIHLDNPEMNNLFFPSLLLQPVIENSLKHGIKSNPNGKIGIKFEQKNNKIICTVEDNGEGIIHSENKKTSHRSMGLELIQQKIKIIEDIINEKIVYEFNNKNDEKNTGTITKFIIPIITTDKYVTNNNS